MSEDSKERIRKVSDGAIKYLATALVATCVYYANQIRDDVTSNKKELQKINLTLQKMTFLEARVQELIRLQRELEQRLRVVEK